MIETMIVSMILLEFVAEAHVENADDEKGDDRPDKDGVAHNAVLCASVGPS